MKYQTRQIMAFDVLLPGGKLDSADSTCDHELLWQGNRKRPLRLGKGCGGLSIRSPSCGAMTICQLGIRKFLLKGGHC